MDLQHTHTPTHTHRSHHPRVLALMHNRLPVMWFLTSIAPVAKSRDFSKPDNFQGISLTCVRAKVEAKVHYVILNRVRQGIDPHLRENQNDFREGRTSAAQIFALQRVIEVVRNIVLDHALRKATSGREQDLGFTLTPRGVMGSWVNSTQQDLKVTKALLLYGSECWTLKPALKKSLDGCYTQMLRSGLAGACR